MYHEIIQCSIQIKIYFKSPKNDAVFFLSKKLLNITVGYKWDLNLFFIQEGINEGFIHLPWANWQSQCHVLKKLESLLF